MRRIALSMLLLAALSGIGGRAGAINYVGYVGCSQTKNAVHGYHAIGGQKFWPVIAAYGGGSVQAWAKSIGGGQYWDSFKANLAAFPTNKIWVQWCVKSSEPVNQTANANKVLAEIRKLAPGRQIYVSSQNGYYLPHTCKISGPGGPERMQLLALTNVLGAKALPGPDVGDLRSKYEEPSIPPGDQTTADGCHANEAGATQVLGPNLRLFFG